MGIGLGGLHKTGLQHKWSSGAGFWQAHLSHSRPNKLPQISWNNDKCSMQTLAAGICKGTEICTVWFLRPAAQQAVWHCWAYLLAVLGAWEEGLEDRLGKAEVGRKKEAHIFHLGCLSLKYPDRHVLFVTTKTAQLFPALHLAWEVKGTSNCTWSMEFVFFQWPFAIAGQIKISTPRIY